MSKKPRNKKSNPKVIAARKAATAVKDLAIIYTLGMEPKIYDMRTGNFLALTEGLFYAFHNFNYQWTLYTVVMLETSLGERYVSINECSPERKVKKDEIADALKDEHIAQIKKCKRMDLMNVGWVGFPRPRDLTEKKVTELIELNPNVWNEYQRGEFFIEETELTIEQQLERELSKIN